jgi:two-component system CheB/CheR fusion protein
MRPNGLGFSLTGIIIKNGSNNQTSSEKVSQEFPIVGIGASAGGLEAFRVLLECLPVDTGLAFVIIQHLAADQESMLTDILSRFTKMLVFQVEDGMHVEPNYVYVIPPGSTMTMENGFLKLNPKGKSLRPIDAFLSSLAMQRKTQAIGIVLSGTGTDGTEGLKAIKAEGGITFAQKPDSAQYSGMPQSAISAESVDFVLSPDKIARELSKIAKDPQLVRAEMETQEPKTRKETGLLRIFTLLKSFFAVDFSHYKETVINRRVTRRMVINHIDNITGYVEYLGTHPAELQALFDDMLIGVTSFFREPDTFLILKEKLCPDLLKNRAAKEPIRIWIPGCSTGEEAYSFAIALQEFLEETGTVDVQVQIFGTDVNGKNIDKARQGIYPKSIEADVSENRLKRFFTSFNGSYQIAKFIRDKCVFAKQDLTADPPFSNLDLVSCRNMLIYFDSQLQERIVPILHYALKLNGFLILGESESIGKFTNLFESVNKRGFIYTKKKAQPTINFGFEASVNSKGKTFLKEPVKKDAFSLLREEVDRLLITEYVPAALLVNGNLDILIFRGNITPYLSPESGQASLNVAKIIRKELRPEVQTAVYRSKKENKPVKEEAIRFQYGEQQKTVNIQVMPLRTLQYEESFFLVLFEDVSSAAAHLRKSMELTVTPEGRENVKDDQIRELKDELDSSKLSLQTVIETQEATNEELRAAMEEVQSSNEELQSTNEELETAKEELQSSNEELTTLNDELKNRHQALARLNDNLANLTRNVDPAVVMVDGNLKIRLFTPSAQKILSLIPSDTGLPISNVHLSISVPDLEKTISAVITTLAAVNKEVTDENGNSYEMRVRPYLTEENRIDGAVLSFIDVNKIKKHENEMMAENEKYRTLTENLPDTVARVDRNLRYLYVNSAVEKIIGVSPKAFVGKTAQEIGLPKKLADTWNRLLKNVIQTGKEEKGEIEFPTLKETRSYQYVIVPEFSINGAIETTLSLLKDITDHKKTIEMARVSLERYRSFVEVSGELGWVTNADGEVGEDIPSWRKFTGQTYEEVKGWGWSNAVHPNDVEHTKQAWNQAIKSKSRYEVEYRVRRHDGVYRLFSVRGVPVFKKDGSVLEWVGTCIDITESRDMEQGLTISLGKSRLRESEIAALLKASSAVLQNKEFQGSARAIFDSCKELLGATAGYVALLSDDGKENEVLFLDSGELPCTVDPSLPMPIRGLRAQAYNSGEVAVENDFNQSEWRKFMPNGHVYLKNVLFAPLIIKNTAVGVIGLANKTGGFTKRDAEMAMAFGEIASVALTNSQMLEMLEENEKELKVHSEHLEALVEERTKKLRDSERLAAIGETAGMVGHDIRNPLQSIVGELYLARNNLASLPDSHAIEEVKESIGYIEEQLVYVNKIVQDLQDYAKIPKPQLQEADLGKIIQDVLSSMNISDNITVSCSLEAGFPKIITDQLFLKRILTNLASNAIQAMPDGGKLEITTECNHKKVCISVADTGEGMSEDVKGKLFKPLFTTKSKGQGFGLAVVKKLTEALDGNVSVETKIGKGTRFILEFPMT